MAQAGHAVSAVSRRGAGRAPARPRGGLGGTLAGYGTVVWDADYPGFRDRKIPEIQDLNVLPAFRRRGVATRILDEAERLIRRRSTTVGIGVGLHPGYNAAQRLYVLRGYVPDGLGLTYRDRFVEEGEGFEYRGSVIVTPLPTRIHVTGNAGAGKTTLAAKLGRKLGIPVHSLDPIVWQSGWRKRSPERRRRLEEELIRAPTWIIEGVSARVRAAADLVVFLDVPRTVCLRRALVRSVRFLGRTRPELPEGCPEWRIVLRLLRIIRQFPHGAGVDIRDEATAEPERFRIRSGKNESRMKLARTSHGSRGFRRPASPMAASIARRRRYGVDSCALLALKLAASTKTPSRACDPQVIRRRA